MFKSYLQIKSQKFDEAINHLSLELENHPKVSMTARDQIIIRKCK